MGTAMLEVKVDNLIIRSCSSKLELDALIKRARECAGKKVVLQIFDYDSVVNATHLVGAYVNAMLAFKNNTNIAKGISMEMMLFAGMTKQISEAISEVGAKSGRVFVLFSDNAEAYRKFKVVLEEDRAFKVSREHEKSAAKKFGIEGDDALENLVLQKMTSTRLED